MRAKSFEEFLNEAVNWPSSKPSRDQIEEDVKRLMRFLDEYDDWYDADSLFMKLKYEYKKYLLPEEEELWARAYKYVRDYWDVYDEMVNAPKRKSQEKEDKKLAKLLLDISGEKIKRKSEFEEYIKDYYNNPDDYGIDTNSEYYQAIDAAYNYLDKFWKLYQKAR